MSKRILTILFILVFNFAKSQIKYETLGWTYDTTYYLCVSNGDTLLGKCDDLKLKDGKFSQYVVNQFFFKERKESRLKLIDKEDLVTVKILKDTAILRDIMIRGNFKEGLRYGIWTFYNREEVKSYYPRSCRGGTSEIYTITYSDSCVTVENQFCPYPKKIIYSSDSLKISGYTTTECRDGDLIEFNCNKKEGCYFLFNKKILLTTPIENLNTELLKIENGAYSNQIRNNR